MCRLMTSPNVSPVRWIISRISTEVASLIFQWNLKRMSRPKKMTSKNEANNFFWNSLENKINDIFILKDEMQCQPNEQQQRCECMTIDIFKRLFGWRSGCCAVGHFGISFVSVIVVAKAHSGRAYDVALTWQLTIYGTETEMMTISLSHSRVFNAANVNDIQNLVVVFVVRNQIILNWYRQLEGNNKWLCDNNYVMICNRSVLQ